MKRLLILIALLLSLCLCLTACDGLRNKDLSTDSDANADSDNSSDKEFQGNTFKVTFDSNGGTFVSSQNVKAGGLVAEPSEPTRESYKLIGWFYNNKLWSFSSDIVTKDITLVAQWLEGPFCIDGTKNHNFSDWEEETASSCDTDQVLLRKCISCSIEDRKTGELAYGHRWETNNWTEVDGLYKYCVCDLCKKHQIIEYNNITQEALGSGNLPTINGSYYTAVSPGILIDKNFENQNGIMGQNDSLTISLNFPKPVYADYILIKGTGSSPYEVTYYTEAGTSHYAGLSSLGSLTRFDCKEKITKIEIVAESAGYSSSFQEIAIIKESKPTFSEHLWSTWNHGPLYSTRSCSHCSKTQTVKYKNITQGALGPGNLPKIDGSYYEIVNPGILIDKNFDNEHSTTITSRGGELRITLELIAPTYVDVIYAKGEAGGSGAYEAFYYTEDGQKHYAGVYALNGISQIECEATITKAEFYMSTSSNGNDSWQEIALATIDNSDTSPHVWSNWEAGELTRSRTCYLCSETESISYTNITEEALGEGNLPEIYGDYYANGGPYDLVDGNFNEDYSNTVVPKGGYFKIALYLENATYVDVIFASVSDGYSAYEVYFYTEDGKCHFAGVGSSDAPFSIDCGKTITKVEFITENASNGTDCWQEIALAIKED